jgi:hypothetical protein
VAEACALVTAAEDIHRRLVARLPLHLERVSNLESTWHAFLIEFSHTGNVNIAMTQRRLSNAGRSTAEKTRAEGDEIAMLALFLLEKHPRRGIAQRVQTEGVELTESQINRILRERGI